MKRRWIIPISLLLFLSAFVPVSRAALASPWMDSLGGPARMLPPDHIPPVGVTHPITGRLLPSDAQSRLPLAFIMDNHPAARPQSGLSRADLVVEVPAEGEITRYLALIWSDLPPRVGPVRSARDYCLELAWSLDAIAVHIGGSPAAYALLNRTPNPFFNAMQMSHGFTWVSFRKDPHRLYADAAALSDLAALRGWTGPSALDPGFEFLAPRELPGGRRAHEVNLRPAGSSADPVGFTFDPRAGRYEKSINGRVQTEYETGDSLMFSSVIFLHTTVRRIPGDAKGRIEVGLIGTGRADVFTRGYYRQGTWTAAPGQFPVISFPDGSRARLSPGPVWITFVPVGSAVDIR